MTSAFLSLADALEVMRRERGDDQSQEGNAEGDESLLENMIHILLNQADAPPREVQGASQEFCDGKDCLLWEFAL